MSVAEAVQLELSDSLDKWIARDCSGGNFYEIDNSPQSLPQLYMEEKLRAHMTPYFQILGEIAGGRLDELARLSDVHEPVLRIRSPYGHDEDCIEFRPACRDMEQIDFGGFGIYCMS